VSDIVADRKKWREFQQELIVKSAITWQRNASVSARRALAGAPAASVIACRSCVNHAVQRAGARTLLAQSSVSSIDRSRWVKFRDVAQRRKSSSAELLRRSLRRWICSTIALPHRSLAGAAHEREKAGREDVRHWCSKACPSTSARRHARSSPRPPTPFRGS